MGTVFIDKDADFSAHSVGIVAVQATSVSQNLRCLFDIYGSAQIAGRNLAGGPAASISGGAVFTAKHMAVSTAKQFVAPVGPAGTTGAVKTGFTIALVLKIGAASGQYPVGSFNNASTEGAVYFQNDGSQIGFYGTSSTSPVNGGPLSNNTFAFVPVATQDQQDQRYELFFGTVDPVADTIKVYRPRTGSSATGSPPSGSHLVYNGPSWGMSALGSNFGAIVALFADWNRILTDAERATFYAEMQERLAKRGVAI